MLAERKVDVYCYMIEMGYPNGHFYWTLKGKEKGRYILVLCCQLSKGYDLVDLELELRGYQMRDTTRILWTVMLDTYTNCTDCNLGKKMLICTFVYAVSGLPDDQN